MAEVEIYRAEHPVAFEARVDLNYGDNAVDVILLDRQNAMVCPTGYLGYALLDVHEEEYVIWLVQVDGYSGPRQTVRLGGAGSVQEVREAADKLVAELMAGTSGN